ncbi:aldo/keto reductase [Flagellimonas zhangzhouensis]|uniref:Aldo/keto reductase n=1 Tax=Flagellimonas zhangzhouensis TaxID=1073328 RepID=A0A1H2YN36_9FLAO|nr:aldo/keto reductase [Allomuricauda zhangzhouensis]SDR01848.1 Aldo/keto reductase [Allomuricauda zhangzhouensis]SDX06054.1 Aldo/keto reductase [Allomuricauda zhangzhouensis]
MIVQETYTLNNKVQIPKLGLGTWFIDNDAVVQAVKDAIDLGYRHIDTAQAYQNEEGVGKGIKESGVNRSELFVTTKLAAEVKSYDEAVAAIDKSLEVMGLDYIDLMIIHSPKPWQDFQGEERFFKGNLAAWKALEEAYEAGKLKAIGLSNFEIEDIQNILDNGTVKPAVNQVLAHISNVPEKTIKFCEDNDILVEAYSPIGHGELFKNDDVAEMAEKYGVSIPQLAIRFDLQLGLLPIPKTANPDHMKGNAQLDFEISDGDMKTLQEMEKIKDYGEASKFPVFA